MASQYLRTSRRSGDGERDDRRYRNLRLPQAAADTQQLSVLAQRRWQRRFSAPAALALGQPLTALIFQTIALGSLWSSREGQTRWKGRRY